MACHIWHAHSTSNVRLLLSHDFLLIFNSSLVRTSHPISHCTGQYLLSVWLLENGCRGCILQYVLSEAIAPFASISRADCSSAIATLFEANVAVGRMVVAGIKLKFDPGGWDGSATLDTAFKARGKANEGSTVRRDRN